jgi:hypothetical protein
LDRKSLVRLLEEKQFSSLEEMLNGMEIGDISENILQGSLPLRGWSSIFRAAQECRKNRPHLEKALQEVLSQLDELKKQQLHLESQLKQAPPSDGLCAKLEHLAQCESRLIDSFEQKTRSPDWNVAQMSLDELKVALQIFDVGCASQLISQGFDTVDEILGLKKHILLEYFSEMSMEEKLDLLYAIHMIDANQLDPKVHCKNCGVCSCDNVLALLREYNLSAEMCAKVSIQNLKGKHLTVIPFKVLCSDLPTASMAGSLSRCLRNIKEAHCATFIA